MILLLFLAFFAHAEEVPMIRGEVSCAREPGFEAAQAAVKKAVEAFKKNKDAALKEIASGGPKGRALFAYEGTKVLVSGANPSLNGRDLANVKDVDGLPYVDAFAKLAEEKGEGCVSYRFPNPAKGGRVEQRTAYLQRGDGKIFIGTLVR